MHYFGVIFNKKNRLRTKYKRPGNIGRFFFEFFLSKNEPEKLRIEKSIETQSN